MTYSAMARLREALLEVSAVTALVVASMPPIPKPVKSRKKSRDSAPVATVAAAYMPADMITRQISIVGLRPILSARPPSRMDPTPMPIRSAPSTHPRVEGLRPQSFEKPAEARALESTS